MDNNITQMPPKFSEIAAAVANIRKDLDSMIEMQGYIAKMRRASFDEHVKQGFSPEQALVLCMKMTI